MDFYICFGCSDPNWTSMSLKVLVRPQRNSLKDSLLWKTEHPWLERCFSPKRRTNGIQFSIFSPKFNNYLLSITVKHNLNDAACSKLHSSQLMEDHKSTHVIITFRNEIWINAVEGGTCDSPSKLSCNIESTDENSVGDGLEIFCSVYAGRNVVECRKAVGIMCLY